MLETQLPGPRCDIGPIVPPIAQTVNVPKAEPEHSPIVLDMN